MNGLASYNSGLIWGVSIGVGLALILLGVSLFYALSFHDRLKKQFLRLKERYQKCVALLESDCTSLMARLQYLADKSLRYHDYYAECLTENSLLENDQQIKAKEVITGAEELLNHHNYKALKNSLQEGSSVLTSFEQKVDAFRKTLTDILVQDNDYHDRVYLPKEKLRHFKAFIADHEVALRPVKTALDAMARGLDECFDQYEVYLDKGLYTEADKQLEIINKVIDDLDMYGKELPEIVPLADMVLPQKLKELYFAAKEAEKQVPIYHLRVNEALQEMAQEDERIKGSFKTLAIKGAGESLNSMLQRIAALETAFEKEKEAKEHFLHKWNNATDNTYKLQAQHAQLLNSLPKYKGAFVLDNQYLAQVMGVAEHVDSMLRMKSDLDSAVHASFPQPYSLLLSMLEQLNAETDYIGQTINDFGAYLEKLKRRLQEIHQSADEIYLALWSEDAKIRAFDLNIIHNDTRASLQGLFALLNQIMQALQTQPVDLNRVDDWLEQADAGSRRFIAETEKTLVLAQKSEEAIVYANQYRREFSKANKALTEAETALAQGNFEKCYTIASGIITDLGAQQTVTESLGATKISV